MLTKIKTSRAGLTKSGRIDWENLSNILCVHLAQYGLHGQVIANEVGMSRAQVYYRLYQVGIKLRDYRDGETYPAREIIKRYSIRTITPTDVKILKAQTITPINL